MSADLVNFCIKQKAVFPGIEAFEMGIEIPTLYIVFYDYFYKCSVGDVQWKKACLVEKDKFAPLGPPQAEAFAFMQLKNNYFAWLLDAVEETPKGSLVTDYDSDSKCRGMKSVPEAYLKKLELDVNVKEDNDLVVVPESHIHYQALKRRTDESLKKA